MIIDEKIKIDVKETSRPFRDRNRESEEEAAGLYRKFTTTKQEPVRLAAALRGFFLPEAEDQEKEAYGTYLKSRIRPAVEALIDGDDVEKLEELESLGWLDGKNLDGLSGLPDRSRKMPHWYGSYT